MGKMEIHTQEAIKKYHESTRRKVLEKQYRESVARPAKQDLKEVIERISSLEKVNKFLFNEVIRLRVELGQYMERVVTNGEGTVKAMEGMARNIDKVTEILGKVTKPVRR